LRFGGGDVRLAQADLAQVRACLGEGGFRLLVLGARLTQGLLRDFDLGAVRLRRAQVRLRLLHAGARGLHARLDVLLQRLQALLRGGQLCAGVLQLRRGVAHLLLRHIAFLQQALEPFVVALGGLDGLARRLEIRLRLGALLQDAHALQLLQILAGGLQRGACGLELRFGHGWLQVGAGFGLAQARFGCLQVLLGLQHGELALLALQAEALLRLLDTGVRRLKVCLRLIVDRERVGGVDSRQQLPRFHLVADIDQNLADDAPSFGLHIDDIVGAQHACRGDGAHDILAGDLRGAQFDFGFGGFRVAPAHPERDRRNCYDAHNDCNAPVHSHIL
jgi:hypothetical protein